MKERITILRKSLGLTMEKFGERLGISRDAVNNLEHGRAKIKEHIIKLICLEFHINYTWLTTGEGEMYCELEPKVEITTYISQIIGEKDNPFFDIISETMRTYNQLTPENQKIISSYCKELLHNLRAKKES